jgi:hypothetical protein
VQQGSDARAPPALLPQQHQPSVQGAQQQHQPPMQGAQQQRQPSMQGAQQQQQPLRQPPGADAEWLLHGELLPGGGLASSGGSGHIGSAGSEHDGPPDFF